MQEEPILKLLYHNTPWGFSSSVNQSTTGAEYRQQQPQMNRDVCYSVLELYLERTTHAKTDRYPAGFFSTDEASSITS